MKFFKMAFIRYQPYNYFKNDGVYYVFDGGDKLFTRDEIREELDDISSRIVEGETLSYVIGTDMYQKNSRGDRKRVNEAIKDMVDFMDSNAEIPAFHLKIWGYAPKENLPSHELNTIEETRDNPMTNQIHNINKREFGEYFKDPKKPPFWKVWDR